MTLNTPTRRNRPCTSVVPRQWIDLGHSALWGSGWSGGHQLRRQPFAAEFRILERWSWGRW